MPVSGDALSELFTLFLVVFVLIGLQPTLQKGARKLSQMLEKVADKREALAPTGKEIHAAIFTNQYATTALNDFELIVLQSLARFGHKPVSSKQLNESLLFGDEVFKKTLWSLHRRGLIRLRVSKFLGPRFMLSESGRRYAIEQGYIVQLQQKEGLG